MGDVKVTLTGKVYERKDLLELDEDLLRALLRERTHHNIEVPFYSLLAKGLNKPIPAFGLQAKLVYDVWVERGFSTEDPDLQWAQEYQVIAAKVRNGEKIEWAEPMPEPFTPEEIKVVEKLLYQRHSIRDFAPKPVPDELVQKVLEAGRAAPIGCNLDEVRFIVLKKPEELNMIWSDIEVKNAVVIVIAYDTRIPHVVGQDVTVPQNGGFDAAAAGDHMLLMAHALGLGGVWLSKTAKSKFTSNSAEVFKERYGLPDYINIGLHIAIGWPASGTIKSKRMPLAKMIISKK